MTSTKPEGRVLSSDADIERAVRDARERETAATKIRASWYDEERDAIIVELSTGVTLSTPRRSIAGFADAAPHMLSDVAINPGGESIWSDTVDDGVLLEQLVEIAVGDDFLKTLGGRLSGRRRSPAKARASRANGKKGGRPPLTMTSFIASLDETLHRIAPNAPQADRSENPNPDYPASATWRVGEDLLYVKIYGASEVQIVAAWPRKRPFERRIRAVATSLARAFARHLIARDDSESTIRAAEAALLVQRAQRRNSASLRNRAPAKQR